MCEIIIWFFYCTFKTENTIEKNIFCYFYDITGSQLSQNKRPVTTILNYSTLAAQKFRKRWAMENKWKRRTLYYQKTWSWMLYSLDDYEILTNCCFSWSPRSSIKPLTSGSLSVCTRWKNLEWTKNFINCSMFQSNQ